VSDNLIIVIGLILAFVWLSMQNAMAAALCQGGGISSGCGPSGLILGGQQIVVPGFGTAPACRGRGTSSIFCCSQTRQGQWPCRGQIGVITIPTPYGNKPSSVQPRPITGPVMGMAPQATTLPKPIATHPAPVFNSPQALATPTPALCQYNALETTNPVNTVVSGFSSGNIPLVGPLIRNLTECFCKVNALYGKALQQGIASGKIRKCYAVVKRGCIKPCGRSSGGFGPRGTAGATSRQPLARPSQLAVAAGRKLCSCTYCTFKVA
jgi:hypothetical protein